ncbi:MAG: peptidase M50 [Acidobacteria bacterium]|nr:MAG: peptidase M50 [Acidobacteriota bacterium]
MDWRPIPYGPSGYTIVPPRPSLKSLYLAGVLFLFTLCTCLVAGTQFAFAYAQNQAVSFDEFLNAFTLFYKHPAALAAGLPFALTLLTILLAHELGHFFACRHHHIRASYPFFIPFPSLMGTFGAFILIRSPIRSTRALFDVGASGPLVGFILAVPALAYGVLHAKIVLGLDNLQKVDLAFGTPLLLRLFASALHPGVRPGMLLLHPVGRAAWVGLFATSLNLLPVAQLDGGHILRSLSARLHHHISMLLPLALLSLGLFRFWEGWYVWGLLLLGMRFLRVAPIYDPTPLDPLRRWGAFLALLVFLLCFMPAPLYFSPNPH